MTNRKLLLGLFFAGVTVTASAQNLVEAQSAIREEQYDKAKGILQQLIAKKPKDATNYFYLGQVYLENDRIDSAKYYFEQGSTSDPKSKLNIVGLGTVDLQNGDMSAADSKFASATTGLGKKDYLPLYYVAKAYIDAPKPEYVKAIEYLEQAKQKNAKDPLIFVGLGDAYQGLRDGDQAFYNYREASSIDEKLLSAKIGQAVIGRWSQAYDYVIEQLTGLIEENPNYAPLYRELAETYYYSSRQAPEDQYREINQKAVESYRKYLSLAGENSVDAKVRYADFLLYSGNYAELKDVSKQLSEVSGVDAKVFRYLGFISFLQDKDYAKAKEYMTTLFSKVSPNRLIPRDYLMAGLSELAAGDEAKGKELLKEAVAKQVEDDNLDTEIAETAFAKFQDGEQAFAMKIFSIPASNPASEYYYDANYYVGSAAYGEGEKLYSAKAEDDENGAAALAAAKPFLEKAISAFNIVIEANKEAADKYKLLSLYYKGVSEMTLDNLNYHPEAAKGLFVKSFEELITQLKDKADRPTSETAYLINANTYLGFYYYYKQDGPKAKGYFQETLKLDPENETAAAFMEVL